MSSQAPLTAKVAVNNPLATTPATTSPVSRHTILTSSAHAPREETSETSRSGRNPSPVTRARAPVIQKYRGVYG